MFLDSKFQSVKEMTHFIFLLFVSIYLKERGRDRETFHWLVYFPNAPKPGLCDTEVRSRGHTHSPM